MPLASLVEPANQKVTGCSWRIWIRPSYRDLIRIKQCFIRTVFYFILASACSWSYSVLAWGSFQNELEMYRVFQKFLFYVMHLGHVTILSL